MLKYPSISNPAALYAGVSGSGRNGVPAADFNLNCADYAECTIYATGPKAAPERTGSRHVGDGKSCALSRSSQNPDNGV